MVLENWATFPNCCNSKTVAVILQGRIVRLTSMNLTITLVRKKISKK